MKSSPSDPIVASEGRTLQRGQLVRKNSGAYAKSAWRVVMLGPDLRGVVKVVAEAVSIPGLLHIFSPSQLDPWEVRPIEETPIGTRDEILAVMKESPATRDLYLGAGGSWCFVTCSPNVLRIHLDEAIAMERDGLVVRKWEDYPHYWRLPNDGAGAGIGKALP